MQTAVEIQACRSYDQNPACPVIILRHSCCRDTLKRHYNLGYNYLEVNVNDVASYDAGLAENILKSPTEYLPIVSFILTSSPSIDHCLLRRLGPVPDYSWFQT